MSLLIKNARVFAPLPLGTADILIAADKILAVGKDLTAVLPNMETIDASGLIAAPGLFDLHMHVIGGGGVNGAATRVPAAEVSELVATGTTHVAGVLGTDVISRTLPDLLAKVRGLQACGLNAWMYTSNYRYPPRSITKSIMDDLFCIPECLGVKLALGDLFGSFPTMQNILSLLADIRLAGTLSGKIGLLHVHLGDLLSTFDIFDEIERLGFPLKKHVLPTHCGRSPQIFERACAFARAGGMIDFTTGGGCACEPASVSVMRALESGVALSQITLSTDAHGAKPRFDANGRMTGYAVIDVAGNLKQVKELVGKRGLALESALTLVTENPARHLGLAGHGIISPNAGANVCLMSGDLDPKYVISRGRVMMRNGEVIVKGLYEV